MENKEYLESQYEVIAGDWPKNYNEIVLIEQIKHLTDEEQIEILENGGLSNIKGIMTSNFVQIQTQEKIARETYYAEAIFSSYDWEKIGIEEFTTVERNNLLQRIQNHKG